MRPVRNTLPALALVFNACVWGVSWWPFRQLQSRGLHPLWATVLIYIASVILLLAISPKAAGRFGREPWLWLLALAAGVTNMGFNWAVTVGDVVRVVLLFYLMPAWTVVLAWPILGERPTPSSLLRLALTLAGVGFVLNTGDSYWPVPQSIADWLALAGGFSFSLTNILLRKLHEMPPASRILAMFAGGAAMAAAAGGLGGVLGIVETPPAPQLAWAGAGLALSLGFLAGNLALQYGAARMDAHAGALIMLSEVVFATLSSVALGAAELTVRSLVGGALILVAAAWSAWPSAKSKPTGIGAQS